jgi:hypothetical protein
MAKAATGKMSSAEATMMVSNALLKLAEMGRWAALANSINRYVALQLPSSRPTNLFTHLFSARLALEHTTLAHGSARPSPPCLSPLHPSARSPPSKRQKLPVPVNMVHAPPFPHAPPHSIPAHPTAGDFTTIGPHAIATIKNVVPVTFGSSRHTRRHNDPGPGPGQYPLPSSIGPQGANKRSMPSYRWV